MLRPISYAFSNESETHHMTTAPTTPTTSEASEKPSNETIAKIEAQWHARAIQQHYKRGTKKYQNAESEYFIGAMAALNYCPPNWAMCIIRGEPIVKE